ncbi:hypothetical protein EUTSA_v10019773mg, partial [Eutrema salsugineum]
LDSKLRSGQGGNDITTVSRYSSTTNRHNFFPENHLQDKTFEFEKKRNRPERYDRNVTENTLTAIKKIDKIRSARASKYIEKRYQRRSKLMFPKRSLFKTKPWKSDSVKTL